MIPLSADRIAAVVDGQLLSGPAEAVVDASSIDSRECGPGACFFAIVGATRDGHAFVDDAVRAGATIVIVDRPAEEAGAAVVRVEDTTAALQSLAAWLRRRLDATVVAITGSLGKTSTKEIAATLLADRYHVHATPGNLNNHWGLPLSLLGLEPRHQIMVAEMAMSRAGEIRALARLAAPDAGLITNVAPAHMEGFADLDAVAAAKGELAQELPSAGTLIVNADDPRTAVMPETLAPHVSRVLRFGRSRIADVRATDVVAAPTRWSFTLNVDGRRRDITLNLPGVAGLSSFLAAVAVATALDVSLDDIAARAPSLEPISNRGGIRYFDGLTLLDESYNASPVAMAAALDTLARLPAEGRRIAVLGDMLEMGDWTDRTHHDLGRRVAESDVSLLFAVGACAPLIAQGAVTAGMDARNVEVFTTAEQAASRLPARLRRGDVVLVKGSRGVHLEHVVNAVTAASEVSNGVVDR